MQAIDLDVDEPLPPEVFVDSFQSAETLEQNEYNLILRTLKNVHWKLEGPGGAAELLHINPSTLRSKMRKLGIQRPRYSVQA
jgi:transcriptional regulator with GAF, ATPase, and Fis domain